MYNIAVILAGGIGARVGGNTPKQLLPLQDGKSVLEHAVDAFEQSPHIHEICIVMHPDYIMHAEQMLLANAWQKVRHIIPGGKERWESSVNAIRQVRGERLEARGEENNCQLPIAQIQSTSSSTTLRVPLSVKTLLLVYARHLRSMRQ